jgi:transcriptional regulator with XRE-family HTH domain
MTFVSRRPNPVFSDEYDAIRQAWIAARRRSGLTQRELAGRLGKCSSHIGRIEAGQRRVDCLELFLVEKCLGLETGRLFADVAARLEASGATPPGLASGHASPRHCDESSKEIQD